MAMYKHKISGAHKWLLLIIFIWMGLAMHFYIPNLGGMGLALPQNILAWAMMALFVFIIWLPKWECSRYVLITPAAQLFFIGTLVLAIPLLYTRPEWFDMALWRWGGLLAGWVFYFSWLQVRLPQRGQQLLLYGILLAITIQALLATLQLVGLATWLNYPMVNGRPYGVFQQVNVLASFVATGLALASMLLLLPTFTVPQRRYQRLRWAVLGTLLVIFPALLIWLQSRVGWLGGVMAGLLPLLCFWRYCVKRSAIVLLLLLVGLGFGWTGVWLDLAASAVSHVDSDGARGAMLRTGWAMLQDKPWLGWGAGGFEYNFQHFRLAQGLSTEGLGVVVHPHNELLFWGIEGGAVSLSGIVLLLCGGILLATKAWRRFTDTGKKEGARELGLCIALLPMLLHTQTEYPFDLSVVHWAVFLLLLVQLDRQVSQLKSLSATSRVTLQGLLPLMSLGGMILMAAGLNGGLALTCAERDGLKDIHKLEAMPRLAFWGQQERKQFDLQTHALLIYNRTRDKSLLEDYAQWARGYLDRHIDANVYASLILILRHQEKKLEAEQRWYEAARLFPQDPRFQE